MASTEEVKVAAIEKKEPPKELEEDAKKDPSPKIAKEVAFLVPDTTMNVLPSTVGNMLTALSEGGLSQLTAGARANVGVKSGRYMFEAKIVEQTGKSMVRVGFSAEGSLFLGEEDNSVCFDNEGNMRSNKKNNKCSQGFSRDIIVAVVLNLDEKSPNANTISMFKNGRRVCQPQALPDDLKGKTLFPAVSFRNATVHLNFGAPVAPLPFKCKVMQEATQKDGTVTKYAEPEGGKYTALFPVSLPDEGSFDWLDSFLEKNPEYTEISDRAFTDWALKSGLPSKGKKASNDKPDMVSLDDMAGTKKLLMEVAAMQPRNFVIMEVKGNLIKEDRSRAVAKFKNSVYKTVAEVIASDPPSSFKRIVQAKTLKAKQDASDKEHKLKHVQEVRDWKIKKNTKDMEKAKKKKEKEMKKKAEEAKKKREEVMKKAAKEMAARKAKAEGKEVPEEEEEKPEEVAVESEEEPDEPMDPEPVETSGPKVSLTAEEKAVRYFAHGTPDLAPYTLATSFTKFTLPEDDEFDTVRYSWAKEKEANAYLKNWILEKKHTTRVEDIVPSAWFKQKSQQWQTVFGQWKNKHGEYKAMVSKKVADRVAKAAKKAAAEKKAKMEAEKKAKEAEEKGEKPEATAPAVVEEEEEEPEVEIDFEGIDIFGVEDILDVGGKVPIFKEFQSEDFTMMALRHELHLLVHAFGKDCNDPDRSGIHTEHVAFYYQKYYGKPLNFNAFGFQKPEELLALVNDTVNVNSKSVIESLIPADLESNAVFAKITEASRRNRNLLVDMGDESAKLKFRGAGENGHGYGQKRSWQEAGGQDNGGGKKGGGKGSWKEGWGGGWGKW